MTSAARPPGSRANSRGRSPAPITPTKAGWPGRAAASSITARLAGCPWCMPELATRSRRPPGSAVSPIGACPTRTFAIRARPGSLCSRAAEKASSALLARAVTHTVEPRTW